MSLYATLSFVSQPITVKHTTKKAFMTLIIVLSLSFSTLTTVKAQVEPVYSIDLIGPTWETPSIHILITPPSNESWWMQAYLNATVHAINQWNEALSYFATNHSKFAYLSSVKLIPQVSNLSATDFDAYISWIDKFGNVTCEAGLTRTSYSSAGTIHNCTLTISAYDCRGNILNEADSQNVAVHELGHVLGLGHSNNSSDLMYYAYSLGSSVRSISTLDLYGVGVVFRWMAFSQEFDEANQGETIHSVILPSDIAYEDLPISEANLPPQLPVDRITTAFADFPEVVAMPAFWAIMVLFTITVISIYLFGRRGERRRHVSLHK